MSLSDDYSTLRQTIDDLGATIEWAVEEPPMEISGELDDGRPFYFGVMNSRATLEVGREYPDLTDESLNQKLAAEFERAVDGAETDEEALQAMGDTAEELGLETPRETGFHWQDDRQNDNLTTKGKAADGPTAQAFRTLYERYQEATKGS